MEEIYKTVRRYVSPVFLALLVASFILWYIAKLSYTYTTEQEVEVNVDGQVFQTTCVVEGVGTNLFGYRVYGNNVMKIPLSELKYHTLTSKERVRLLEERLDEEKPDPEIVEKIERLKKTNQLWVEIDPQSLQSAISVRYSDIKVIGIGEIPFIHKPKVHKKDTKSEKK